MIPKMRVGLVIASVRLRLIHTSETKGPIKTRST